MSTSASISSTLKQKRQSFANQIRKKQKQSIIKQRRKILLQQHQKTIQSQSNNNYYQISTQKFKQLLKNIHSQTDQKTTLQKIGNQIQSCNSKVTYLISLIFQTGTYLRFILYLNQKKYLKQTLFIFSVILSRKNSKIAEYLVSKGFLQIIIQLLKEDTQNTLVLLNILANLLIQDDSYCQIILQNQRHFLLIDLFNNIYRSLLTNNNYDSWIKKNLQKTMSLILWNLCILVGIKQSPLDFERQYDQILQFFCTILNQRAFQKQAIGAIYQLAVKNQQKVQKSVCSVINKLLQDQTGQSSYLQDLLILVLKLSPGNFRYDLLLKISFISNYQILVCVIRIFNRLENSEIANQLAKNQAWWDYVLTKIDNQKQEFSMVITMIRRLKIAYQSVWRFVSQYMDTIYSNDTIKQVLILLRNSLLMAMQQSLEKRIRFIQMLGKFKIWLYCEKLTEKQNYNLSQKAEQIVFLVQKIKKNAKQQFQIEIEG